MNTDNTKLVTGPSPHLHYGKNIFSIMKDVLIALIPISILSLYIFGIKALLIIIFCVTGALLGEIVARKYKNEKITIKDGTALVSGLFLALILPPTDWWIVVTLYTLGGFMATSVFREAMGGLGKNKFNPALMARVFILIVRTSLEYISPLLISFFPDLSLWLGELETVDAVSQPTPLLQALGGLSIPDYNTFLFAYEGGSLAETSVLAIILGAAYLFYKGHIKWQIPTGIIGTVFILSPIFNQDPLFNILAGGLLFGSFFMATDWGTRPITNTGRLIYGIGIGILICFFRFFMAHHWEPVGGVAFSIIIMNSFVPFIENLTKRTTYGKKSKRKFNLKIRG